MDGAAGSLHPVLRIAASACGGVLALASLSTRAAFGPNIQKRFDSWFGVDLDAPLPAREPPRSPFGDVPHAFLPAAPHAFPAYRPRASTSGLPHEAVLSASNELLSVMALPRRARSETGAPELPGNFWRARDPAAGLLQGLRFDGLTAPSRQSRASGGVNFAALAPGTSVNGVDSHVAPRPSRDIAVSAALAMSRRLSGAGGGGGGAPWQLADPLRGPQHGSPAQLAAHLFQGSTSSVLYRPLGVLSSARSTATNSAAAAVGGNHQQPAQSAQADDSATNVILMSTAKAARPPQVASAPTEQSGSRQWLSSVFGIGTSAAAAQPHSRGHIAGMAFKDIDMLMQSAPQPAARRQVTLSFASSNER